MSDLRNKLIRLAHAKPELRKDLLPLLAKKAYGEGIPEGLKLVGKAFSVHPNGAAMLADLEAGLKEGMRGGKQLGAWMKALTDGYKRGGSTLSLEGAAEYLGSVSGGMPVAWAWLDKVLKKHGEMKAKQKAEDAYRTDQWRVDEDHYGMYWDD